MTIAILSSVFLLACGDSPTAPNDDLVGTWVVARGSDVGTVWVLRADGTFRLSSEAEGIEISYTGSWEIVSDKLVIVTEVFGEVRTFSEGYTLRGDRLTLVDEDGSVEIWERRE